MSKTGIDQEVLKALTYACNAHGLQTRKGTNVPYMVHPLGVAQLLLDAGCGQDTIIAGILHDVPEDSKTHTLDEILYYFGPRIGELVEGATEPHRDDSWEKRIAHTIQFISGHSDVDVLAICCADKLDNILAIEQDLRQSNDEAVFWGRFNRGKDAQSWYYTGLADALSNHADRSQPLEFLIPSFHEAVGRVFP